MSINKLLISMHLETKNDNLHFNLRERRKKKRNKKC